MGVFEILKFHQLVPELEHELPQPLPEETSIEILILRLTNTFFFRCFQLIRLPRMKEYLTKFSYKNTETPDLWACLEEASKKPVGKIMTTWWEMNSVSFVGGWLLWKQNTYYLARRSNKILYNYDNKYHYEDLKSLTENF